MKKLFILLAATSLLCAADYREDGAIKAGSISEQDLAKTREYYEAVVLEKIDLLCSAAPEKLPSQRIAISHYITQALQGLQNSSNPWSIDIFTDFVENNGLLPSSGDSAINLLVLSQNVPKCWNMGFYRTYLFLYNQFKESQEKFKHIGLPIAARKEIAQAIKEVNPVYYDLLKKVMNVNSTKEEYDQWRMEEEQLKVQNPKDYSSFEKALDMLRLVNIRYM